MKPRGTLSRWVRSHASTGVAALITTAYAIAVVPPRFVTLRDLQRQLNELDGRRVELGTRSDEGQPRAEHGPPHAVKAPKAGELVPEISLLGLRNGLQIRAIKQSADNATPGERVIRVLAEGHFPALVAFMEAIGSELPQGRIEELSIRHVSGNTALEMESVVRVRIGDGGATDLPQAERR